MKITPESHLDHGLTEAHVEFLKKEFADRDAFFIETITLPEEMGTAPCGIHGPIIGDDDVSDDQVVYAVRGDRPGKSRLCDLPTRQTRAVSVIAGPSGDDKCVLYTAFGGPVAPREPFDGALEGDELQESKDFWAIHALSGLIHEVKLANGVRVANFSSPHSFKFEDGTVLEACSKERATSLMLNVSETVVPNQKVWVDIQLVFELSDDVELALREIHENWDGDIVLVPLPVLKAVQAAGKFEEFSKIRCIRVVNRVTREISISRFTL